MAPAKTLGKSGAGRVPDFEGLRVKQQGLPADKTNQLLQLDTGSRQNHDSGGDQLLAIGTIVDGGLRPDGEIAFNLSVGVNDEFEFVGILVAIQRERELRRVDIGNGPGNRGWLRGIARWPYLRRSRGRPQRDRKAEHEEGGEGNGSAKTHDGKHLQAHGVRPGKQRRGTKNAKGVEGPRGWEKKKRKELTTRMKKEMDGTGTQIVHPNTFCGWNSRGLRFGIAASVSKTS
jgi:hypothetical protein